jgi:hypothetical protein
MIPSTFKQSSQLALAFLGTFIKLHLNNDTVSETERTFFEKTDNGSLKRTAHREK